MLSVNSSTSWFKRLSLVNAVDNKVRANAALTLSSTLSPLIVAHLATIWPLLSSKVKNLNKPLELNSSAVRAPKLNFSWPFNSFRILEAILLTAWATTRAISESSLKNFKTISTTLLVASLLESLKVNDPLLIVLSQSTACLGSDGRSFPNCSSVVSSTEGSALSATGLVPVVPATEFSFFGSAALVWLLLLLLVGTGSVWLPALRALRIPE